MPNAATRSRCKRRVLCLALLPALLFLILFALAQTPPGKQYVVNAALRVAVAGTQFQITADNISGVLPIHLRLGTLRITDRRGPLLDLYGLDLRLDARALLRGRLHARRLTAERAELWNRPPVRHRFRLPRLPEWSVWPAVDHLFIECFHLHRTVIGMEADLRVTASARPVAGQVLPEMMAHFVRTDQAGAEGRIVYDYEGNTPRLSVNLKEETFLPLWLESESPFLLEARGRGTRADWQALLRVATGTETLAEGSFHFSEAEATVVDSALRTYPAHAPALRAAAQSLGETLDLRARAALDRQGSLTIEGVELNGEGVAAALRGAVDLQAKTTDVSLHASCDDLRFLSPTAQIEAPLPLALEAEVSGPFEQISARAALNIDRTSVFHGEAQVEIGDPTRAQGEISLTPPPIQLFFWPESLQSPLTAAFDVAYFTADARLELAAFRAHLAGAAAEASGTYVLNPPSLRGQIEVTAERLAELPPLLPFPVSGDARLRLEADGDPAALTLRGSLDSRDLQMADLRLTSVTAALQGSLSEGHGGPAAGLALEFEVNAGEGAFQDTPLGACHAAGSARFSSFSEMELTRVEMSAGPAHLSGAGLVSFSQGTGRFSLGGTADIDPDSRIGLLTGTPVHLSGEMALGEGMLRLTHAEAKGKSAWAQASDTVLRLSDGGLEGLVRFAIDYPWVLKSIRPRETRVMLDAEARLRGTIRDPGGTLTGQWRVGGQSGVLRGTISHAPDAVALDALEVESGPNRATGRISARPDGSGLDARIEATIADLGALAAEVGVPVSGHAELVLRLADGRLTVDGNVREASLYDAALDAVTLRAEARQGAGLPEGQATLNISGGRLGRLRADSLHLRLSGTAAAAQVEADLAGAFTGAQGKASPITSRLEGAICVESRAAKLKRWEAGIADAVFAVEPPLTISLADGWALAPATLRAGGGRIAVEGALRPEAVSLAATATDVPLEMFAWAFHPAVAGLVSGELRVSGAPGTPEVNASLSLRDGRVDTEVGRALAPLSLSAQARYAEERLGVDLQATIEDALHAVAKASLACSLRVWPGQMALIEDRPLSGSVELQLALDPLLQALGLAEHRLHADLNGAFALSGTPASPHLSGEATMDGGRYENVATGTVARNLSLALRADGPVLTLAQCRADMGERGSVSAEGMLRLDPAAGFPFEVVCRLSNAHVFDLDYASGRAEGTLRVGGSLSGVSVTGDLRVGPAYVTAPGQLPEREPPTLEVIEVRDGQVRERPAARRGPTPSNIRLDIRCDVPGGLYVRAPVIDSEWGGRLHIGGTLGAPFVTGELSPLRGHMDFLGRRFELRESVVAFRGETPISPFLDARAAAQTRDVSAELQLTGTVTEMEVKLHSEPPLPQEEILSRILFGSELSRISPVQALQLARIGALFGRGIPGTQFLVGNIGLPGIDRLDIRTGERLDETVVGLGKYFSDAVYVEVQQGATSESGKVSVEVEVTPRLSVKGDVDAKERSGIGLFWRRNY